MKSKTISKNIRNKMNEWLKSIKNEELRKEVQHNMMVSGGCIVSMFQNEQPNDYDVYITDKDVAVKLAQYYIGIIEPEKTSKVSKIEVRPTETGKYQELLGICVKNVVDYILV